MIGLPSIDTRKVTDMVVESHKLMRELIAATRDVTRAMHMLRAALEAGGHDLDSEYRG